MEGLKDLNDVQLAELYFSDRKNEVIREELKARKLSLKVRILKENLFTTLSHNVASPLQKLREVGAIGIDRSARLAIAKQKKKK